MTPRSRIIQIIKWEAEEMAICLCEDGSIWGLNMTTSKFYLVTEMDGVKYV